MPKIIGSDERLWGRKPDGIHINPLRTLAVILSEIESAGRGVNSLRLRESLLPRACVKMRVWVGSRVFLQLWQVCRPTAYCGSASFAGPHNLRLLVHACWPRPHTVVMTSNALGNRGGADDRL